MDIHTTFAGVLAGGLLVTIEESHAGSRRFGRILFR
jgi:hypothetical protein